MRFFQRLLFSQRVDLPLYESLLRWLLKLRNSLFRPVYQKCLILSFTMIHPSFFFTSCPYPSFSRIPIVLLITFGYLYPTFEFELSGWHHYTFYSQLYMTLKPFFHHLKYAFSKLHVDYSQNILIPNALWQPWWINFYLSPPPLTFLFKM